MTLGKMFEIPVHDKVLLCLILQETKDLLEVEEMIQSLTLKRKTRMKMMRSRWDPCLIQQLKELKEVMRIQL
jgi:hypothetical protein